MKRFFICLLLISFLVSAETEKEVGRYQLETTIYVSKKGITYIVETVLDTKTGKIVGRNKILLSMYNKVDKK